MAEEDIKAKMLASTKKLKSRIKASQKPIVPKKPKSDDPPKKKKKPTAKEQYEKLRQQVKDRHAPRAIAFQDNFEEELIKELFKGEISVDEAIGNEEVKKAVPERVKTGLWDYVLEDEIEFFDPECSYELTGYKPINDTKGLDFDPDWFTEPGRIYTETGKYTEYPSGSKQYADYWMEQLDRCANGYTINGYRITGDHYFFLNFYRMDLINEKKKIATGADEGFPRFLVEQYKFFHYFEMCEHLKKDVVALKSRGIECCAIT